MPRNVRIFAWLWCISIPIAITEIFVMPAPPAAAINVGFTPELQAIFTAIVMAIFLAISLPLFWLAVWRRKNWARLLLLLFFVVSLPLIFLDHEAFHPDHLAMTMLTVLSTLVEGIGFLFLFVGDANAWYKGNISAST